MTPEDHIDEDGGEPIEMLARYCDAHGWPNELVGEDEIVTQVQGSWTSYELRGVWRDDDGILQILLFPEIKIVDDRRAAALEALGTDQRTIVDGPFRAVVGQRHDPLPPRHLARP